MEDISMRGAVVRISQDSMEAYLTLQPPEAGEMGVFRQENGNGTPVGLQQCSQKRAALAA